MEKTKLEGFPIQYGKKMVSTINRIYNERPQVNKYLIEKSGKAISLKDCKMDGPKQTEDRYTWFGKLEFSVDNSRVAILFPWAQDFNNSKSQLDRSINVYADKPISKQVVSQLVEKVAYNMALSTPNQILFKPLIFF
jgi:hypothetical protein